LKPRATIGWGARSPLRHCFDSVADVDGILQKQSAEDVDYFLSHCSRRFSDDDIHRIKKGVLGAYRWQYIFSGVEHPRFKALMEKVTTGEKRERIISALATLS
jgi:hypothetical protein